MVIHNADFRSFRRFQFGLEVYDPLEFLQGLRKATLTSDTISVIGSDQGVQVRGPRLSKVREPGLASSDLPQVARHRMAFALDEFSKELIEGHALVPCFVLIEVVPNKPHLVLCLFGSS